VSFSLGLFGTEISSSTKQLLSFNSSVSSSVFHSRTAAAAFGVFADVGLDRDFTGNRAELGLEGLAS
jgi:hypothetical protein